MLIILPLAFLPIFRRHHVHSTFWSTEADYRASLFDGMIIPANVNLNTKINSQQTLMISAKSRCNHAEDMNIIDSNENFEDYSIIRKGEVYVEHNFLTHSEITEIRNDIAQLKNASIFKPSGLSNRVAGDQNEFGNEDRLTCTITPDLMKGDSQFSHIRSVVDEKLEMLKQKLQLALTKQSHDKISTGLELELAEMYYSISPQGSYLPMHNDERHEDTKGEKGWMHETRRSISWLIYLNDDGWGGSSCLSKNTLPSSSPGNGGELRAYCRRCSHGVQCGSHEGNIQVGWLQMPSSNSIELESELDDRREIEEFEPIFLDSWIKTSTNELCNENPVDGDNEETLLWHPLSALYRLEQTYTDEISKLSSSHKGLSNNDHNIRYEYSQREYLSKPFGANSPGWPSDMNLEPSEFAKALSCQLLDIDLRNRFVGIEDIDDPNMIVVHILPTGGTLVMFDSVAVPHEVLGVEKGGRLAVAGWFHEMQQEFPDWYGT